MDTIRPAQRLAGAGNVGQPGKDGRTGRLRRPARLNPVLCLGLLPVVVFFLIVYGAAIVHMFLYSLGAPDWSLDAYSQLAENPPAWRVLGSTIRLAAGVTFVSALLGYPIAFVMLRASPRTRLIITLLVTLPLWTSTLVRSYAWMVLLGRQGIVNHALLALGLIHSPLALLYNRGAVYVGMVHVMVPYMVFPIYGAMKQVDLRLIKAARSLGSSPMAALATVFFPLTIPGLTVGAVLVFVMSLGFWVTPTLLGGIRDSTYVMLIDKELNVISDWSGASAMSTLFFVVTVALLVALSRIFGIRRPGAAAAAGARNGGWLATLVNSLMSALVGAGRRLQLSRSGKIGPTRPGARVARERAPISWTITLLSLAFLVGPVLVLFPLSFSGAAFMQFPPSSYSLQWYARYFSTRDWIDPTLLSLKVAMLNVIIAVPAGTLCAIGLATLNSRLKAPLLYFIVSPLIIPPVVMAVAFYLDFARFSLVGTQTGLVLAHLILTIPYVIVVVLGALSNFDFSLVRASRSLGAKPLATIRRVVLPLIWPSVLTAALFAFLTSFDEVVIAVFLSGSNAVTLPKRLLDATRFEFQPTIAAVSVLLIVLTFAAVSISNLLQKKRVQT